MVCALDVLLLSVENNRQLTVRPSQAFISGKDVNGVLGRIVEYGVRCFVLKER